MVGGTVSELSNRRRVDAYAGLAPTPCRSGSVAHEQGGLQRQQPTVAKTAMIQLTWLWVRHQARSILTLWFRQRVQLNGGRIRKVLIVALARKAAYRLLEIRDCRGSTGRSGDDGRKPAPPHFNLPEHQLWRIQVSGPRLARLKKPKKRMVPRRHAGADRSNGTEMRRRPGFAPYLLCVARRCVRQSSRVRNDASISLI